MGRVISFLDLSLFLVAMVAMVGTNESENMHFTKKSKVGLCLLDLPRIRLCLASYRYIKNSKQSRNNSCFAVFQKVELVLLKVEILTNLNPYIF